MKKGNCSFANLCRLRFPLSDFILFYYCQFLIEDVDEGLRKWRLRKLSIAEIHILANYFIYFLHLFLSTSEGPYVCDLLFFFLQMNDICKRLTLSMSGKSEIMVEPT